MASGKLTEAPAIGPSRKSWWPLLLVLAVLIAGSQYAKTPRAPPVFCDRDADPRVVDVMMLSASWCRYCARARDFFVKQNIDYCEYDIETSAAGAALHRDSGVRGVPVIFIGEDVIVGFNPYEIGQALVAADALGVERL